MVTATTSCARFDPVRPANRPRGRGLLILALLFPALLAAEYRVPSIDQRESSAPVITGRVIEVSGNLLIVASGGAEVSVLTNRDTHIFTSYGGLVLFDEICPGSALDIWFRSPDANVKISPAVAIRVPATC